MTSLRPPSLFKTVAADFNMKNATATVPFVFGSLNLSSYNFFRRFQIQLRTVVTPEVRLRVQTVQNTL